MKKILLLLLAVPLILATGCTMTPKASPVMPDGEYGLFVGATFTAQPTSSERVPRTAQVIQYDIQNYTASRASAIRLGEFEAASKLQDEIDRLNHELRELDGPEPGFWKGLYWDWREGEKLKTTGMLVITALGGIIIGEEAGWWDLDDSEADGNAKVNLATSKNLKEIAQESNLKETNSLDIRGSGNSVIDLAQDRRLDLKVSGNGNTVDFERETFREPVTFVPIGNPEPPE